MDNCVPLWNGRKIRSLGLTGIDSESCSIVSVPRVAALPRKSKASTR